MPVKAYRERCVGRWVDYELTKCVHYTLPVNRVYRVYSVNYGDGQVGMSREVCGYNEGMWAH